MELNGSDMSCTIWPQTRGFHRVRIASISHRRHYMRRIFWKDLLAQTTLTSNVAIPLFRGCTTKLWQRQIPRERFSHKDCVLSFFLSDEMRYDGGIFIEVYSC